MLKITRNLSLNNYSCVINFKSDPLIDELYGDDKNHQIKSILNWLIEII